MQSLNPFNDPMIVYLRVQLATRVHRLRTETDRSRGASAIEWAIITGILAAIAIAVGAVIRQRVREAADNISTGDG
jgi:Flp pilus assembly pilin Flp